MQSRQSNEKKTRSEKDDEILIFVYCMNLRCLEFIEVSRLRGESWKLGVPCG